MKYSENIDYLLAAIGYLGVQSCWWARSVKNMAAELSLDEKRLEEVFNGFPGLFRKSRSPDRHGRFLYSLQARYAQRDDEKTGEDFSQKIAPLSVERVEALTNFVVLMAGQEKQAFWSAIGNATAGGAAVLSALTAIAVAFLM